MNLKDYGTSVIDWRGFKPLSSVTEGFAHDPWPGHEGQSILQSPKEVWYEFSKIHNLILESFSY